MSLARVYNAFIKAGVDETTATEAIEAIETSLDEPWKRRMEIEMKTRFARLEWMCRVNMILISVCLALLVGVLLRVILV